MNLKIGDRIRAKPGEMSSSFAQGVWYEVKGVRQSETYNGLQFCVEENSWWYLTDQFDVSPREEVQVRILKVGDRIRHIGKMSSCLVHGRVYEIIAAIDANFLRIMCKTGSHTVGRQMDTSLYEFIEDEPPITLAEAARALPLPSTDDAARFMGVKR